MTGDAGPGRALPDQTTAPTGAAFSLRQTFAAMAHFNYRLWFIGQLVSLMGTWMQTTAQGFLIYQLTHSAAYLGYVGFAAGVPSWLFTLYGGVIDTLVFFGLMPVGSLLAGVTATRIGEAATVGAGALILLGFAAWVWLRRPELRRVA